MGRERLISKSHPHCILSPAQMVHKPRHTKRSHLCLSHMKQIEIHQRNMAPIKKSNCHHIQCNTVRRISSDIEIFPHGWHTQSRMNTYICPAIFQHLQLLVNNDDSYWWLSDCNWVIIGWVFSWTLPAQGHVTITCPVWQSRGHLDWFMSSRTAVHHQGCSTIRFPWENDSIEDLESWCQLCCHWWHCRLSLYDNLRCHQWRQSWHHDNSQFPVKVTYIGNTSRQISSSHRDLLC